MNKQMRFVGIVGSLAALSASACELVGGLEKATVSSTGGGGQGGSSTTTGGGTSTGGVTGGTTNSGGTTSSMTPCDPGTSVSCYSGPPGTDGKGICHAGTQMCKADGSGYEACEGEQTPKAETCASADDEDCDGSDCAIWATVFGDAAEQRPFGVVVDNDGNTIVVGTFKGSVAFKNPPLVSAGGADVFVVKLDTNGKVLWSARFGNAVDQSVNAVAVDGDGNIFLTGLLTGTIDFGGGGLSGKDVYIAKLNPSGGHVWSHAYVATAAGLPKLAVGPDGQVVFWVDFLGTANFGTGNISAAADRKAVLFKLGANGSSVDWLKQFVSSGGSPNHTYATALGIDPVGSASISGYFAGAKINMGGADIPEWAAAYGGTFLAKFDSLGNHAWSGKGDWYYRIIADALGNRFVTSFDDGQACNSAYVVKYSNVDAKEWAKTFSCPNQGADVDTIDIAADPVGNVAVTIALPTSDFGFTFAGLPLSPFAGGSDIVLGKLDTAGTPLWARRFGDAADQKYPLVATAPNGDIVIAAQVSGTIDVGTGSLQTNGQDLLIARFAP